MFHCEMSEATDGTANQFDVFDDKRNLVAAFDNFCEMLDVMVETGNPLIYMVQHGTRFRIEIDPEQPVDPESPLP